MLPSGKLPLYHFHPKTIKFGKASFTYNQVFVALEKMKKFTRN